MSNICSKSDIFYLSLKFNNRIKIAGNDSTISNELYPDFWQTNLEITSIKTQKL